MTFKTFLLKNYTQNKVKKLVANLFLKSQNLPYIWIISLKFYMICFQFMSKSWATKIYWNYGADHLILPHINLFWKKISLPHILHDLWREKFFTLLNEPNFFVWLPLLLEISGNTCIAIIRFPFDDAINSETNLNFVIKPFSSMTKTIKTKITLEQQEL